MNRRLSFCLPIFISYTFISTVGLANNRKEAERHFKAGLALLETEDYEAAAVEFDRSAKLYPSKTALFNLANCYKALHQYGKAIETIDLLKKKFAKKLNREWRGEIETFDRTIKSIIAELTITVNRDGAHIRIDGRDYGTSPLGGPIILGPGNHEIVVSAEGYITKTRKITIISRQKKSVRMDLELQPTPEPETEINPPQSLFEKEPQAKPKAKPSALFWTGTVLTVLSAATAGVFLGLANVESNKLQQLTDKYNELDEDEHDDELWQQMEQHQNNKDLYGNIGLSAGIAAGVFAVGSVIVLIINLSGNEETDEIAFIPAANGFTIQF